MSSHSIFGRHRRRAAARRSALSVVASALLLCLGVLVFARVTRVPAIGIAAPQTRSSDGQNDRERDLSDLRARDLVVPVQGVPRSQLVPSFAQARDRHVHEALDIMAPHGTPVIAVEAGTVAKLFTSKQGGLTIYQFDPSGAYAYYYAHLDRYADGLAESKRVSRGELLGYVGATGNAASAQPHLHFTIFKLGPERHWWQGVAIDPFLVFAASQSPGG